MEVVTEILRWTIFSLIEEGLGMLMWGAGGESNYKRSMRIIYIYIV